MVDDWNSLPSKVVEARDVEQFKAELDRTSWMKLLVLIVYSKQPIFGLTQEWFLESCPSLG